MCGLASGGWGRHVEDLDEQCEYGRIVSPIEYARRVGLRSDIFSLEREAFLRNTEIVCLGLAVGVGIWLTTAALSIATIVDMPVFPIVKDHAKQIKQATLLTSPVDIRPPRKRFVKRPASKPAGVPTPHQAASGNGGGITTARRTREKIRDMLAATFTSDAGVGEPGLNMGAITSGIDAILLGTKTLKSTGGGEISGRANLGKIGFGKGYEKSGYGGDGTGDWEDLMAVPDPVVCIGLKRPPSVTLVDPGPPRCSMIARVSGRSRQSIETIVAQNMQALRYAYSSYLRRKPHLRGKVSVQFAIDEFGRVLFCKLLESTVEDEGFAEEVLSKVKRWSFGPIDKPGDVTEVVYPFVFSP